MKLLSSFNTSQPYSRVLRSSHAARCFSLPSYTTFKQAWPILVGEFLQILVSTMHPIILLPSLLFVRHRCLFLWRGSYNQQQPLVSLTGSFPSMFSSMQGLPCEIGGHTASPARWDSDFFDWSIKVESNTREVCKKPANLNLPQCWRTLVLCIISTTYIGMSTKVFKRLPSTSIDPKIAWHIPLLLGYGVRFWRI